MSLEREHALTLLDALVEGAAEGHGKVALIRGEAGIGKTALVDALIERQGDVFVLRAAAMIFSQRGRWDRSGTCPSTSRLSMKR